MNSITGEPVKGAHVRLFAGSLSELPLLLYGAMTDAAGKFSVDPIEAGTYRISAERPGFVFTTGPGPSARVKAGERLAGFKLELTPRAIISGRVVDEYGDPVQSVSVQVSPAAGRPVYQIMSGSGSTDDRGEFRLGVGPGKYHLKAVPRTNMRIEPGEARIDSISDAIYAETYYPNAATPERAVVIEAAGGREITGIEVRLARRPNLTISGVVTGLPGGSSPPSVSLSFTEPNGRGSATYSMSGRSDGKFAFASLAPGLYRLYAQSTSSDERQLYSPLVELTLEGASITGLELPLIAAEDLTGSVRFEEEPAGPALEGLTVRLEVTARVAVAGQGSGPAKSGKDGALRFRAVPPGQYRVRVEPLPENGYVKTVQLDGSVVPDGVLDLTRGGGGSVKILLSRNGAQISGSVKLRDDTAASDTDGIVCLFQDVENLRPENFGRVTPKGTYVFRGVRPGRYRLVAVDPRLFVAGPDWLKELAPRAEQIEVKEGDRLTKDLKLITTEDADAKQR